MVTGRGRCECGGVRYEVTGPLRDVYNCHCGRCRRITGHHMAATATRPDAVHLLDRTTLRWYAPDDSCAYGFCGTCGSTLFWRARSDPDKWCIAAGTLDQPTGLRTTKAWWVAEAADYHDRPGGVLEVAYEG
jgi:hypothetical protein